MHTKCIFRCLLSIIYFIISKIYITELLTVLKIFCMEWAYLQVYLTCQYKRIPCIERILTSYFLLRKTLYIYNNNYEDYYMQCLRKSKNHILDKSWKTTEQHYVHQAINFVFFTCLVHSRSPSTTIIIFLYQRKDGYN